MNLQQQLEELYEDYRKLLSRLNAGTASQQQGRAPRPDEGAASAGEREAEAWEMLFVHLLLLRDRLALTLQAHDVPDGSVILDIKKYDDQLFNLGTRLLRQRWINMVALRDIRQEYPHQPLLEEDDELLLENIEETLKQRDVERTRKERELGWWWYLDQPRTASGRLRVLPSIMQLLWGGLAILVLLGGLQLIADTSSSLALVMLQLFTNLDIFDLGFDLITIVGIIVQVLVGGQLVLLVTHRFADGINNTLWRIPHWLRNQRVRFPGWVLRYLLPISPFFVGMVLFLLLNLGVNRLLLPPLESFLLEQADRALATGNVELAPGVLNTAEQLSADVQGANYSGRLIHIGQEYEDTYDLENAILAYQRALQSNPCEIYAFYLLSELYTDSESPLRAIQLLDEIFAIQGSDAEAEEPPPEPPPGSEQAQGRPRTRDGDWIAGQLRAYLGQHECPEIFDRSVRVRFGYLLLVSRGRAYLAYGSPRAAQVDLDRAFRIAQDDADFPRNVALPALHYYTGQTYDLLYEQTGHRGDYDIALESWGELSGYDDRVLRGEERLWKFEALQRLGQD